MTAIATENRADDLALELVRAIEDLPPSPDAIVTALRLADRLNAVAVGMLAAVAHAGGMEGATGLPAEWTLRLEARRMRWDASELTACADVLATMPSLAGSVRDGRVSWSQARAIVREARGVDVAGRGALDRVVAEHADRLSDAEPEALLGMVQDEASALREGVVARREDRAIERSFLTLQPRLDGSGSLYGEADAQSFATITEALDAAAERPHRDDDDDDGPRSRARQRMQALVGICESHLAGGTRSRPRPRLLATVQVDHDGRLRAGQILWRLPGAPPRLSRLGAEVLASDAEVIPVAFAGARPVAVGDATHTVSERRRRAVVARDGGCRFPGCGVPAEWSDVHHVVPGHNRVEWLILLCRRCHRRVHRQRWRIRWCPDGCFEFSRQGRRYRSAPRVSPPRLE